MCRLELEILEKLNFLVLPSERQIRWRSSSMGRDENKYINMEGRERGREREEREIKLQKLLESELLYSRNSNFPLSQEGTIPLAMHSNSLEWALFS